MALLVLGLLLFLGIHSVSIAAPAWRQRQVASLGDKPWKAIYSIVSGVGLALLIIGYDHARRSGIVLYQPPLFLRHLTLLLMVPVFPLLIATYFPGRISRAAKHPMLLAVKIWATAHLLANGSLADVLLFGGFLAWAVADRISVKRRSPVDAHAVPGAPPRPYNDLIAIFGGIALYLAFIGGLHYWLIGVSPLAGLSVGAR